MSNTSNPVAVLETLLKSYEDKQVECKHLESQIKKVDIAIRYHQEILDSKRKVAISLEEERHKLRCVI